MHNRQKAAAVLCIMGDDIVNSLTDFDKRLLNILQGNLPLCSRPFSRLGEILDTPEEHVLRRLNEL